MPAPAAPKERLFEAAYACIGRFGLAKTTMDDVAREAKLSRATVYRYFPQGKDQLVREVVAWEAGRFFMRLTAAVAHHGDLGELLEATVLFARRAVDSHEVLQKILETEPDRLLPVLTTESGRLIALVKQFLVLGMQRTELRDGLDVDAASDYLARMVLSLIGGQGGWDLRDAEEVRTLVRTYLLPGVVRSVP